jgi:hypothetical protein
MIVFTKLELEQGAQKILDFIQDDGHYNKYSIAEVCFILNAAIMLATESGYILHLAQEKAIVEAENVDPNMSIEEMVNRGIGIYTEDN